MQPTTTEVAARPGTRPGVLACLAVLLLPVLVVLLGDARFHSGSDAGGKAATVELIADRGLDGVDVGYWAEAADPDGTHHPMINTKRTDVGWVQVTSAVLPSAAALGARVAGDHGALWLSMLAVPLGALAAARLSRRLGGGAGWVAFVVVGALSPLTFYGADQWEHAPALALGLWAVALLVERPDGRTALLAGLTAGAAVVLRREVVFFLLILGLAELLVAAGRAHWTRRPGHRIVPVLVGGGLTLAVGFVFDRAVVGGTTGGRSATQAARAGSELAERLSDAVLTTVVQYPRLGSAEIVLGVAALAGMVLAGLGWRDDDASRIRLGCVLAVGCVAIRILSGTGFVPGAFAVLPLTGLAPVLARDVGRRLLVVAGATVTATIAFQWTGSLAAQWGGRYLLLPAAVVAVVAAAEIERRGWRQPVARVALGTTAALAVFGLLWHVERTDWIGARSDDLEAALAVDDVVVSTHAHFPRELGAMVTEGRWLRANTPADVPAALAVAATMGVDEIRLLHEGGCATDPCGQRWAESEVGRAVPGWQSAGTVPIAWFGPRDWVLETLERD